jgi:hypothetical protein
MTFILAVAWAALAGCASTPHVPALVNGTTVTESYMGFNGISIIFPEKYHLYHPLPKGTQSSLNAQWAWSMSTDYDKGAGTLCLEHVVFESGNMGIAMGSVQLGTLLPRRNGDAIQNHVAWCMARGIRFSDGEVVMREPRVIGGRYVACIARNLPAISRFNAVYIVPVPPSCALIFNGACGSEQKESLLRDMDQTLASLTFN